MYNFLTIGYDCSPASALQFMNLRTFALPFDWVQSNINSIERCFSDNFSKYHTNLRFNKSKTRLIDEYGFQFPHDYPFDDEVTAEEIKDDEHVIWEGKNKCIVENWQDFYDTVKDKYNRRIKRFIDIVNDTKPIIVLCRYITKDVLKLKELFKRYYNKENIYYINSCADKFYDNNIININTEKNGKWNDSDIWKPMVDKVQSDGGIKPIVNRNITKRRLQMVFK